MSHSSCCGALLKVLDNTISVCESCGTRQYNNPKGAVAVVLKDSMGRFVFAKRANDPYKGKLDCVGGFLDFEENYEAALYRELAEETGLKEDDLEDLTYIGSAYDNYPWGEYCVPVASVYFIANVKHEALVKAGDDVASFVALELKDLDIDKFAWNGMREIFTKNYLV